MEDDRTLGPLADLETEGSREYDGRPATANRPLFAVKTAQGVFGYINACPHTGATLNWLPHRFCDTTDRFIQCAMHGALFEKESGLCIRGPCVGRSLTRVSVAVRDGMLVVAE